MNCDVCAKPLEGKTEVWLSLRFPLTGAVHKGTMHVDCAIAVLGDVKKLPNVDKTTPPEPV